MAPTATLAEAAVTVMDFSVGAAAVLLELLPPPHAANRPARPNNSKAPKEGVPGRYLRAKPRAEIGNIYIPV